MRVLCIDDDFSKIENEKLKKLYTEHMEEYFPKKGLVYDVDVHVMRSTGDSYTLKGLKSASEFGIKLSFLKERFITTNDFIPIGINEYGYEIAEIKMDVEITIDLPPEKADEIENIIFTHDGNHKQKEYQNEQATNE